MVLVSQFGFVAANVFYDGFLPDIATDDTIDQVSSKGFALGYLGGGLYLLLALILICSRVRSRAPPDRDPRGTYRDPWIRRLVDQFLVLLARPTARRRAGERDRSGAAASRSCSLRRHRLQQDAQYLARARAFPQLLLFVVAFVFYNSGTGTVIAISGRVAEDSSGLGAADHCPGLPHRPVHRVLRALMFGALSTRIGPERSVLISGSWSGQARPSLRSISPRARTWVSSASLPLSELCSGECEALSRSLYGTMIPEEASAEFFGFYSVFSKLSGIGPLIFGLISAATGSGRPAILSVAAFFVVGGVLLSRVDVEAARSSRERWHFDGVAVEDG